MKRQASELTRMRPALQSEHNVVSSPVWNIEIVAFMLLSFLQNYSVG